MIKCINQVELWSRSVWYSVDQVQLEHLLIVSVRHIWRQVLMSFLMVVAQ